MRKVIHSIRQKPDHHKNRIIWLIAAAAIVLLLIIWAIVGSGRKLNPDENFFQTFNQDLEEGKTIIPTNALEP